MQKVPGICYHRGQQKYYVTLDGREVYLSERRPKAKKVPPEVEDLYRQKLAAWLREKAERPVPVGKDPTVRELWASYDAAEVAKLSRGARDTIRRACTIACEAVGDVPARLVGPKRLREVRERFVALEWARPHVNRQVRAVVRMFKWGVSQEVVAESVWSALRSVEGLKKRDAPHLRESEPVEEVPDAVIAETLPYLRPALRALVQVHRLIGCRADEACEMRTMDLERFPDPLSETGEVWRYTPAESKNNAAYWVGPRAQALLLPLLRPETPAAWLFPCRRHPTGRGCYSRIQYRRSIAHAIVRANRERAEASPPLPPIPHWHPLQLRHAAGEEARRSHPKGLEAVQARLRHQKLATSEIYAHRLDELGKEVARRLG